MSLYTINIMYYLMEIIHEYLVFFKKLNVLIFSDLPDSENWNIDENKKYEDNFFPSVARLFPFPF